MKLINLRLKDEPWSICIEAEGQVWDLHNAFDFNGLHQHIAERSVRLIWRVGYYAVLPVPAQAFEIVFEDVDYFEVTPRDPEIPDYGEDFCLSGVSRVSPDDDSRELIAHGVSSPDFSDERFHLWFAFRSEQHIRIGAKTATFKKLA